jgi:hypothetical protein
MNQDSSFNLVDFTRMKQKQINAKMMKTLQRVQMDQQKHFDLKKNFLK